LLKCSPYPQGFVAAE